MQCKKSNKINIFYTSSLSTISTHVVLEIMGSCITSEVSSEVEIVVRVEVLVMDSFDVIRVTGACDVNLAPVDQFLKLIYIVFFMAWRGGHRPWSGGRVMAVCRGCLLLVVVCCRAVVHAGMTNAPVMSNVCSLCQMCASFTK